MNSIHPGTDKKTVFTSVENFLETNSISIQSKDDQRPWGGFFCIDNSSLSTFLDLFFPDFEPDKNTALSPKILLVEPGKRLSWQYHYRRSEVWSILSGTVGIVLSSDNQQPPLKTFETGEHVIIEQEKRHRLVGLDEWGIVAEIWKHTDLSKPSDEDDIVRLEDDFGR